MASLPKYPDDVSPAILAASISVLLLTYTVVSAVNSYRKLSQFPGPPLAALSRFYLFWQSINCRHHKAEYEAIKKYGAPCRWGPNLVLAADADVVRHMASQKSRWRRSSWYEAMKIDPRQDSVFSTRDDKLNAELKSKMIGAYTGREVSTIERDIDARIIFTLDVLSTIAFGSPFGYIEANEDVYGYSEASNKFLPILEFTAHHKPLRWLVQSRFMSYLAAPKDSDEYGVGPVLRVAHQRVAERFRQGKAGQKDMLGHFIEKGISQERCEVESIVQIVAGSDSTSTVLRSTLYALNASPVAYMKLRSELDTAAEAGAISLPVITYAEAQKLTYLQAVIWEGIRMYPPLVGLKSKVAPGGGDTIKGIYYPEKTEVALCDNAMCRNPDIFGDDADVYRPDRWIEAEEKTGQQFRNTVEAVFGAGKWMCLGKHIALNELTKVYVALMRDFDWSIVDPKKGVYERVWGAQIQKEMWMSVRARR